MVMKVGRTAFQEAGYAEPESVAFPEFPGTPAKGTYLDKMVREGKVTCVPPEKT